MSNIFSFETQNLTLRPLDPDRDISNEYIAWLNDPSVNQYLECRFHKQTHETTKQWIENTSQDQSRMLFGIFDKKSNTHIGNITFYNIESVHKCHRIGICIGNKKFWNKGLGLEALNAAVLYSFEQLKNHRIEAGIYASNIASLRLFEKAGFIRESICIERFVFEGKYLDMHLYVRINPKN